MRQRPVKNLEELIAENSAYKVEDPKGMKGKWASLFNNPEKPLWLEVGSGKGQFAVGMAMAHPEVNFIACEAVPKIYVRILQKATELQLDNLMVLCERIELITDYFADDELERLFLNFSDPWPKNTHEKRRLTYGKKLELYKKILKNGSVIQFKTDNDALFEYSLEQFDLCGFKYVFTRDLYSSEYAAGNITTEYEDRFAARGKNINFARLDVIK